MDIKMMYVMLWCIEDIDLNWIDCQCVVVNEDLLLLLCVLLFIESGLDFYMSNLSEFFNDDLEVFVWFNNVWEYEELQYGCVLKVYIVYVWFEFDWDIVFVNFFVEYLKICLVEVFEKICVFEMVVCCVVEMGMVMFYCVINECLDELVLKEIIDNICMDEVCYYKYFFKFFKKYNQVEGNGWFVVFGVFVCCVMEIKNEDFEIVLCYVFVICYLDCVGDSQYNCECVVCINLFVWCNLLVDMCVKMLFKLFDLFVKIQLGVYYLFMKIMWYVFLC